MLSRALSLATVMLLIGCLAAGSAFAGEQPRGRKSPSQIFAALALPATKLRVAC